MLPLDRAMPTRQHWDALLSVTVLQDGSEIAKTRTLELPTADFVVAYDQGTDTLTLRVSTSFVGSVTDLSHGERSFSTTGDLTGDPLHPLATPDPEGTPGFLSSAFATDLTGAIYTPGNGTLAKRGPSGQLGVSWLFVGSEASAAGSGEVRLPALGGIKAKGPTANVDLIEATATGWRVGGTAADDDTGEIEVNTTGSIFVRIGPNPIVSLTPTTALYSTFNGVAVAFYDQSTNTATYSSGAAIAAHVPDSQWFVQLATGSAVSALYALATAGIPNLGIFGSANSAGQGVMTWWAAGSEPGSNPSAGSIYAYVGSSVTTPRFLDPSGTTHRLKNGGGWRVTDVKVAAYNAVVGDHVRADPSGGDFNVTLPASAEVGDQIRIKNVAGSGTVTADVSGGGTIDGAATDPVTSGIARACKKYMWDGAEWEIVAIA